ncbi:hypothetical protein QA584_26665 [Anaerocolumna sp. AGMB13025]|nr:TOPRIM nucleotidyl transferase/hydrolase domain-containing protein [Anaerocolumna sp. AGMB13025]WFR57150.1 hypothetical protein QA584_26665 [Anaerocolumna sp. AGMB13025]
MGFELDRLGLVICNINSTNFTPYCQFAKALGIPFVVITDGDYYHDIRTKDEEDKKKFGDIASDTDTGSGFDGIDRSVRMCKKYIDRKHDNFCDLDFIKQKNIFAKIGIFIGEYTFEVDIFKHANSGDKEIICSLFNQLTSGGEKQQSSFKENLINGDYYKCLSQIESSYSEIGKGRFAQRLADKATSTMIPQYILDAINKIVSKVRR